MDPNVVLVVCGYLGSGLAIGLGGIGPAYGMGVTAAKACDGVMRQPDSDAVVTKVMLVGQAVASSPSILAFLVSMFLLLKWYTIPGDIRVYHWAALIAAGLSTGLGSVGPGYGAGIVSADACEGVAKNPESEAVLIRTMLIGQAVAQSTSIYAFVISMCLLFVVK